MIIVFALLLLGSLTPQAAPEPTFETDLGPSREVVRAWVVVSQGVARLHATPSDGAPVMADGPVDPAQLFRLEDIRYVTVKAGSLRALSATTIRGRALGATRQFMKAQDASVRYSTTTVRIAAGGVVDFLQDGAAGVCFVRVDGKVIEAAACPARDGAFRLMRAPVVERWARLTIDDSTGWVKVDDNGITIVTAGR